MSQKQVSLQNQTIKFKSTNTSHEVMELVYKQNKTVLEYKQEIAQKLNDESFNVKLIFKGKVLNDKQKAEGLNIKNSTVMMVLTKNKKSQKQSLSSAQQSIPRNNLNTGLGSTSPIGFGGYGIMNHPQYMSAISSAVDEQKMQQIMNDPYYQGMMEQLLDDPETLKQMLEENPMTKQLMEQNPMMKMMMSNPAMMKMVFNKDTIKMVTQMKKKGQTGEENILNGINGLNAINGLNGFNNIQNSSTTATNPFGQVQNQNMLNNPFLSMMNSGFGNQPSNLNQNFPNMFTNPMFNGMASQFQNPSSNFSNLSNLNNLMQNVSQQNSKIMDEQTYKTQIQQLNSMGFNDKSKCIQFLKECEGDIDKALQKLCLDDDEKSNKNDKKQ